LLDDGFLYQCHRRARFGNKKSQEVRTVKAEERAEQIRSYKAEHPELSNRAIAKVLGFGRDMVDRVLRESGRFTYIR
jgi:hypothetical protein